ncbi:MAG: 30S ribosomal protein S8 [Oscillospiraceae bacterium]|nr:30S ribosomal protein S8 [Oscillospiraceae bacterium]
MQVTDAIADMLTRIRNANTAKHETVDIPASKIKKAIADILVDEGYVRNYQIIEDGRQGIIKISLKYGQGKTRTIQGIRRVSKPGLRKYSTCEDMPSVLRGLGIAIVSTSKGIMTGKKAKKENIGGEILAFVW